MKKMSNSILHIVLEILSLLFLLFAVVFTIVVYPGLSSQISIAFYGQGVADKFILIWILIFCTGLYCLFTGIGFFPNGWSLPNGVTELNKGEVQQNIKSMLLWSKFVITGVLAYSIFDIVNAISGLIYLIGGAFLLLLGELIYYECKTRRIIHKSIQK